MTDVVGTGQENTGAGEQQTETTQVTAPEAESQGQETGAPQAEGTKPEEATYDFTMPEGVEIDKDAANEFTNLAKEYGLKPDQAQKVADIGAKMMQKQAEVHANTVRTWVEQVKADKDIGGDKFDESLAVAKTALDSFGTPELKDVLNATGMGNHPAIVKFFYQVGKKMSPDTFVGGQRSPGGEKDPARILFPNMN